MLNGTLCATERALCCVLENYQTDKGVVVPDVLRPYVGCDFIPYNEKFLPKEPKEPKKKGKKEEEKKKEKNDDEKKEEKKEEGKNEEEKKE
jgi:seryl-tRNA synthetase